jgi:hypothetical protein
MQVASIDLRLRAVWYSGSDRPAWRMNQTGVYGTGWRRQARRKGDSWLAAVTSVIISQRVGHAGWPPLPPCGGMRRS